MENVINGVRCLPTVSWLVLKLHCKNKILHQSWMLNNAGEKQKQTCNIGPAIFHMYSMYF